MSLKLAIVHYHLNPGGVTRVVEHACTALGEAVDVVVLSGEAYPGHVVSKTVVVPELRYTGKDEKPDAVALVDDLQQAATLALQGEPDVWHIHNHALGKNSAMPEVVALLATKGAGLLLQIHDFAEDGRPGNFAYMHQHLKPGTPLFPIAERIHYAGLNGRDVGFLQRLGVADANLHFLPNPVVGFEPLAGSARIAELACEKLFIYPTRGIRRKNMGEFVLAAASAVEGELYVSTLGPDNPAALPIYERWVSFAQQQQLPAQFGISNAFDFTFGELIAAADVMLTTSVAEGFGLAFLEPWLMDKPLLGRNLSDITNDFRQAGIDLSSLYPGLSVPIDLVGLEPITQALEQALTRTYAQYGQELPQGAVAQALVAMMPEPDRVDFGRLNEPLQECVVQQVAASPALRTSVRAQVFSQPATAAVIAHNHKLIEQYYSLQAYGKQLQRIYKKIAAGAVGPIESLNGEVLLECFLAPNRFCLLRS